MLQLARVSPSMPLSQMAIFSSSCYLGSFAFTTLRTTSLTSRNLKSALLDRRVAAAKKFSYSSSSSSAFISPRRALLAGSLILLNGLWVPNYDQGVCVLLGRELQVADDAQQALG